ncbi:efflux RND transporter periplasmic adaptor subunit [Pseudorhodoplanes sp.]|jgi:multidrug efflux system membrane fusion protein|uniref:efflux RND transporter periplasmic adaptor subunit n=1 Tax=Pseudorhodoplanes sp. TaxID=1934341 RepID=UPI002BB892D4|nr:efflux RND transporter periplasmic adaptor subunit [Pseudorhodoplanes sp.]HWV43035.1 efflux RND transporter periplasmic adaptor subunit [Pseudorhodoplanes sp.]
MIRQKYRVSGSALVLVVCALVAGCGQQQPQQQQAAPPPPAVTVATPNERTITDHDEYVGRFVAVDAVEIRARVSGYLDKIHFKDGQVVKEGDLLFTIDKRPFQTALDQAKAQLERARAELAFAQGDLDRASQLVRDKTITQQTFDQRTQVKRVAEANVAAQEAAVRQAQLDLEFTDLRAPVSGRIGDRRVSIGNLVTGGTTGNTTLLATIVSTDPIRFEFTFDEASYLRYERLAAKGNVNTSRDDLAARGGSSVVRLRLIDEKDFVHVGRMDFVDNVIDRSTGTIRGRAVFANAQGLFTPGMFARVQVPGSAPYTALLVPDTAIGSEQARKFVYVVRPDNTVVQKYVELGQLAEGERVIKSGLEATDRVIVEGLMRARPGIKVTPQVAPGPASAGTTARK